MPDGAAARGREPETDELLQPQGGLRVQDGEGQRQRQVEPDHPRQQPRQDRRAEVRQLHEEAVRVLRRLVPHHARHSVPLLRLLSNDLGDSLGDLDRYHNNHDRQQQQQQQHPRHQGQLLPHRGGRVHVRGLQRGLVPLAQEVDRDAEPRGDQGRRAPEILQPPLPRFPASLARAGQDHGALHVLPVFHRLPRAEPTAGQARELPVQPFPKYGGSNQVRVPHDLVSGRRREHGLPDGTRAEAHPHAHRGHGLPGLLPAPELCSRPRPANNSSNNNDNNTGSTATAISHSPSA